MRRDTRHRAAQVVAGLLAPILIMAPTAAAPPLPEVKQGYWWYQAPPAPEPDEDKASDEVVKPVIPPMTDLARWSPPRIRDLIAAQRDYAATVLTVEAVADFWRLEDFARRKARAFAGVTQIAMLRHPELNARSANPMIGDARALMTAEKHEVRRTYLRHQARDFALVMFSRASCGYCRVQYPIVERFRDEMGWQVSWFDIDRRPDIARRFGVDVTPTTMVIRRGSRQHMVIASGVEAYPNLAQMAYQAVKLLTGDIRPEQFLTGAGEEGGFFDALSLSPVGTGDATGQPAQVNTIPIPGQGRP